MRLQQFSTWNSKTTTTTKCFCSTVFMEQKKRIKRRVWNVRIPFKWFSRAVIDWKFTIDSRFRVFVFNQKSKFAIQQAIGVSSPMEVEDLEEQRLMVPTLVMIRRKMIFVMVRFLSQVQPKMNKSKALDVANEPESNPGMKFDYQSNCRIYLNLQIANLEKLGQIVLD